MSKILCATQQQQQQEHLMQKRSRRRSSKGRRRESRKRGSKRKYRSSSEIEVFPIRKTLGQRIFNWYKKLPREHDKKKYDIDLLGLITRAIKNALDNHDDAVTRQGGLSLSQEIQAFIRNNKPESPDLDVLQAAIDMLDSTKEDRKQKVGIFNKSLKPWLEVE